jgi:hypothetical protein
MDDMVSQILNAHDHPCCALGARCLQYDASSGKRPHTREVVGTSDEPLIDEATSRLVEEKFADFIAWED